MPALVVFCLSNCAQRVQPEVRGGGYGLPMGTIFKGESKFRAVVAKGQSQGWAGLPLGERTMKVAAELVGTPYVNFTLEVDDHIEAPVVNFNGMDCWTFYENSLAIARMLKGPGTAHQPLDMLRLVELERYRDGRCTGQYLSRMHHLEEVFADNQRRGLALNITSGLPGAVRLRREIREMTVQWRSYRYLRANPKLLGPMASIERRVSRLPVYHVPKSRVRAIESRLQSGDICAITSNDRYGYTSHVGLILRRGDRAWFVHATSDRDKGRRVVVDRPITDYLYGSRKHAGIVICRPKDLPMVER